MISVLLVVWLSLGIVGLAMCAAMHMEGISRDNWPIVLLAFGGVIPILMALYVAYGDAVDAAKCDSGEAHQ